jgi:hypothetical protein
MNHLKSPIIILGFGRSGTSIVSDIIFQHSNLAYLSTYNAKFIRSDRINYIRHIFDNKFWRISTQKQQLNKVSFLNRIAFRTSEAYSFLNYLTDKDFSKNFLYKVKESEINANKILNRLNKLVKNQGRARLSFKITGPSRLGYLNSIFPDAKYILVKREPLPNIKSLLNVEFYQKRLNSLSWKGAGVYTESEQDFVKKYNNRPELIAALQYYKVNQIHEEELLDLNLTDDLFTINYEDFVADPQKVISETMDFCGLEANSFVNDFLKKNKVINRNKIGTVYFSNEIDEQVKSVAIHGVSSMENF